MALDAPAHGGAVGLVEPLEGVDAHRVAPARGEAEDPEAVAGGGQGLGEQEQAVADDVDDPGVVVDVAVGGQRQVRQQQAGEVPGPAAQVAVEGVGVGAHAGRAVGGQAQVGVQVQFLPVALAAVPDPRRGQGLELVAQAPGGAPQVRRAAGRVRRPGPAGRRPGSGPAPGAGASSPTPGAGCRRPGSGRPRTPPAGPGRT